MLVMGTTENPAYPLGKLVCSEKPVRLDDLALGLVHPLRLDCVQPRALFGQKATDDPHSASVLLDLSVVPSEPPPHLLGDACQLALSQMRRRTFLPRASSSSAHHERKHVVM